MIIRYPTGLYKTVLPQKPSDDESVTYTISSTVPPRSIDRFQEIPLAQAIKPRVPITDELDRREWYGDLIYTTDDGTQSLTGSVKKSFEVGQILDFDQDVETAPLPQAPQKTEIRHDTNLLDLRSTGLTEEEISELTTASEQMKQALDRELTQLVTEMANTEIAIQENQKGINETQKTKDAAEVVLVGSLGSGATGSPILDRLDERLVLLNAEKQTLIEDLSSLNTRAQNVRDELLKVSQLVR